MIQRSRNHGGSPTLATGALLSHRYWGITWAVRDGRRPSTASLREALALDDTFADAHFNLGRALEGQEKLEEACAQYRRVVELRPWDTDARLALGRVLARLGRRQAGPDSPRATACFW